MWHRIDQMLRIVQNTKEHDPEQLSKYDLVEEAHLTETGITNKVKENFFSV